MGDSEPKAVLLKTWVKDSLCRGALYRLLPEYNLYFQNRSLWNLIFSRN